MAAGADAEVKPSRVGVILLFTTVVLYARPQGVSQGVILALVSSLLVFAWLKHGVRQMSLDTVGAVGAIFLLAVFAVSITHFSVLGAAVASSTLAVPWAIAWTLSHVLTPRAILNTFDTAVMSLTVVSLIVAAAIPSVGITPTGDTAGAWRGVFEQRNTFGFVLMLAACTSVGRSLNGEFLTPRRFVLRVVLIGGALVVCGSTSALAICAVIVVLGVLLRSGHRQQRRGRLTWLLAPFIGGLLLLPGLASFGQDALAATGKQSSFEGRFQIWQTSWDLIQAEPWFGYGRGVILDPDNIVALTMAGRLGYFIRSIHDGFLAITLECGIPAAAIGVLFWILSSVRATRGASEGRSDASTFMFLALAVVSINNIFESRVFMEVGWLVVCLACFVGDSKPSADSQEAEVLDTGARRPRASRASGV